MKKMIILTVILLIASISVVSVLSIGGYEVDAYGNHCEALKSNGLCFDEPFAYSKQGPTCVVAIDEVNNNAKA